MKYAAISRIIICIILYFFFSVNVLYSEEVDILPNFYIWKKYLIVSNDSNIYLHHIESELKRILLLRGVSSVKFYCNDECVFSYVIKRNGKDFLYYIALPDVKETRIYQHEDIQLCLQGREHIVFFVAKKLMVFNIRQNTLQQISTHNNIESCPDYFTTKKSNYTFVWIEHWERANYTLHIYSNVHKPIKLSNISDFYIDDNIYFIKNKTLYILLANQQECLKSNSNLTCVQVLYKPVHGYIRWRNNKTILVQEDTSRLLCFIYLKSKVKRCMNTPLKHIFYGGAHIYIFQDRKICLFDVDSFTIKHCSQPVINRRDTLLNVEVSQYVFIMILKNDKQVKILILEKENLNRINGIMCGKPAFEMQEGFYQKLLSSGETPYYVKIRANHNIVGIACSDGYIYILDPVKNADKMRYKWKQS